MSTFRTRRRYRSANLFLVRLWTKDGGEGTRGSEWCGKVQRAVSSESREFSSLQNLVEVLLSMTTSNERR